MKRVLIIEDDLDAANVLEAYLKRDQFHTSIASDGKRGLDLASSWKPDIILLDVMLPLMNGTDVLLALRRRSDTPVIMITAIGDGSDKSVHYVSVLMITLLNPITPLKSLRAYTRYSDVLTVVIILFYLNIMGLSPIPSRCRSRLKRQRVAVKHLILRLLN